MKKMKQCASKKLGLKAQEIQDAIFRRMSVERKLELWAQLWFLAKELRSSNSFYEKKRSQKSTN